MTKEEILNNLNSEGRPSNKFLKSNNMSSQEAYDIVYGRKKCAICDDNSRFISFIRGYAEYCGKKCSQKHKWTPDSKERGNQKRKIYWETNIDKKLEKDNKIRETNKVVWCSGSELRINQTAKLNFEEIYEKGKQTKLEKYSDENFSNRDKAIATCLEKYGVANVRLISGVTEKIQKTFIERYGVLNNFSIESVRKKCLETKYLKYISRIESLGKLKKYYKTVWSCTKKQNISKLENHDKRGRIDLREDAHHLDHMYSIKEGFRNNVSAEIIGSIHNLKMIPALENCSKSAKCSITIDELHRRVNGIFGE